MTTEIGGDQTRLHTAVDKQTPPRPLPAEEEATARVPEELEREEAQSHEEEELPVEPVTAPTGDEPLIQIAPEIDVPVGADEPELEASDDMEPVIIPGSVNEDDHLLEEVLAQLTTQIIILGSGGAGNNTVHRLMEMGIEGASVVALNTDAQHLLQTQVDRKILLGRNLTKGLGAGSLPRIGENAAEESRTLVADVVKESDIVFLTCGLGGGTGTGSIPILARIAKEAGALTIAIVTIPFKSEGAVRMNNAIQGLNRLREVVDTVIVIPNDRLLEVAPLQPLNQAFISIDEVMGRAIKCMTEITTKPGLINIDFADLRTIMRSGGVAMVGTGESSAENRAIRAVDKALTSPLLPVDITGAKGALINVTGGNDMTLKEAEAVLRVVQSKINKEARIIWGASVDESLDQTLRVMLVVTGVQSPQILGPVTNIEQELENRFGIDFVQ